MGGNVNAPKKESRVKRWFGKQAFFLSYLTFAIFIPLVIINSQFGMIGDRDTSSDKKITGWGIVGAFVVIVFIYNEITKRAKLQKDETAKEAIGSFMKSFLLLAMWLLIWIVGRYNWELQVIFGGSFISEFIASIFEIPYNRMVEEDRLKKQERLAQKIKDSL